MDIRSSGSTASRRASREPLMQPRLTVPTTRVAVHILPADTAARACDLFFLNGPDVGGWT
jgi:hypothetical protein